MPVTNVSFINQNAGKNAFGYGKPRTQGQVQNELALPDHNSGLDGIRVYGSSVLTNWINDMKDGVDALDIAVVGDSNTGFNAPNNGGWVQGLSYGLDQIKPNAMYATPLCNHFAGNAVGYKCRQMFGAALPFNNLVSGNANGPAALTNALSLSTTSYSKSGGGAGSLLDYAYVASGTAGNDAGAQRGIELDVGCPIGNENALVYRVLGGGFNTAGGSFSMLCRLGSAPFTTQASTTPSTNIGQVAFVPYTLNIAASAGRTGRLECIWAPASAYNLPITGPFAIAFSSVYRVFKGWAVDGMHFRGGASVTDIHNDVIGVGVATTATMLGEYRSRQIAAGGTGRVVVWIHGGLNQSDWSESVLTTQNTWISRWDSMIKHYRQAWSSIGGNPKNLAFCAMVSQNANTYTFAQRRALLQNLTNSTPDLTVVDMGTTYPTFSAPEQDNGDSVHLSQTGYNNSGNAIIQAVVNAT